MMTVKISEKRNKELKATHYNKPELQRLIARFGEMHSTHVYLKNAEQSQQNDCGQQRASEKREQLLRYACTAKEVRVKRRSEKGYS